MPKITIKIEGRELPCYPTMGAALGFKNDTGRDIEQMSGSADFAVYLYNCAKSACRREKVDFGYSLQNFCDNIPMDEMNSLAGTMSAEAGDASDGTAKKNS